VRGVVRGRMYDPVEFLKSIYKGDCPYTLRAVAHVMYPYIFEDLERSTCPICGKQLKNRSAVWRHVRKTECSLGALAIADSIYGEWERTARAIEYRDGKYVVEDTGRQYDTFEEAYRALRKLDVVIL